MKKCQYPSRRVSRIVFHFSVMKSRIYTIASGRRAKGKHRIQTNGIRLLRKGAWRSCTAPSLSGFCRSLADRRGGYSDELKLTSKELFIYRRDGMRATVLPDLACSCAVNIAFLRGMIQQQLREIHVSFLDG